MHKRNKKSVSTSILIWDAEGTPSLGDYTVVLWQEFLPSSMFDYVSIPELVEHKADELKKKYLSWVYDFGEIIVKDKRLIEYLEIHSGFSYWWMTLFAEKCNYIKSPQINNAISINVILC